MEVAHGVDLHHIDEGGHHEQIGKEADHIVPHVHQEVQGSQYYGHQEYTAHNGATEYQVGEVPLLGFSSLPMRVAINVEFHHLGVEACGDKVGYDTYLCEHE